MCYTKCNIQQITETNCTTNLSIFLLSHDIHTVRREKKHLFPMSASKYTFDQSSDVTGLESGTKCEHPQGTKGNDPREPKGTAMNGVKQSVAD